MKVDIFTLCNYANVEFGRINIIGAFDAIAASDAPIVHPLCGLAIRMRFEKIEEGTKKIKISFIDIDGKPVMPTLEAGLQFHVNPDSSTATVPFSMIIQQIRFPNFGEYSIDLAIDGRQEASTPLYVRKAQRPPFQIPPGQPFPKPTQQ